MRNVRIGMKAGLVIVVVLGSVVACAGSPQADVVVSAATAKDLAIAPAGTGAVNAAVDHAIVISRRATVTSVNVVEGGVVHAGDTLLTVDTIGQSEAVATAANQLRADEKELASVGARDGKAAATTLTLLARVAKDRQALTDVQSAPTEVTAPASGRVAGLTVKVGAQLTRTDVAMHVLDDSSLKVTVPVAVAYRGLIKVGQVAAVTQAGSAGATFPATVAAVGAATGASGSSTSAQETVPITVDVPNQSRTLAVGGTVYVRFSMTRHARVAVNSLAVLGTADQPFVFVVNGGHVEQRAVVTGVSDGSATEIVSGVAAEDEVVISGGHQLISGASVRVTAGSSS